MWEDVCGCIPLYIRSWSIHELRYQGVMEPICHGYQRSTVRPLQSDSNGLEIPREPTGLEVKRESYPDGDQV
jgi:hypothetical protein